jgi:predicted nucleic acid-binding protein
LGLLAIVPVDAQIIVTTEPWIFFGIIHSVFDYFLSKASIRKVFYLWRPFLKDPKDDLVLEVAVESQARYIITFNKRDFKGVDQFGIEVVTPRDFLMIKGILK